MSKYILPTSLIKQYNVEIVDHWEAPEVNDARCIGMPNVPKALHGLAPRTVLGNKTWDIMRKKCYREANDTCEICGIKPDDLSKRHAHELYSIDYKTGVSKFERCICLCYTCHVLGIHTGRALTLYKQGSVMATKQALLAGAENAFKVAYDYNKKHKQKFKLNGVFLSYLKQPALRDEMIDLIKKYKPKFYITIEDTNETPDWGDWKLIIGDREYNALYQNEDEWQEAMAKNSKNDTDRKAKTPLVGGVFDELDAILNKKST